MNTKSVPSAQAQAQYVVTDRFPFTAEAIENAAAAMAERLYGGDWQSYPEARKHVWRARAHAAAGGGWKPMALAPWGDTSACIDIWCAEDECRRTDCFPGLAGTWLYETFDSATNGYHHTLVRRPVAWMPAPVKPEGV